MGALSTCWQLHRGDRLGQATAVERLAVLHIDREARMGGAQHHMVGDFSLFRILWASFDLMGS